MNETKEKSSQIGLDSVLRAIGFYGAEGRTRTGMGSTQRFLSFLTCLEGCGIE